MQKTYSFHFFVKYTYIVARITEVYYNKFFHSPSANVTDAVALEHQVLYQSTPPFYANAL